MAIKTINPIAAPAINPIGSPSFSFIGDYCSETGDSVYAPPSETDESATGAGVDYPSIATEVSTPDYAAIALN